MERNSWNIISFSETTDKVSDTRVGCHRPRHYNVALLFVYSCLFNVGCKLRKRVIVVNVIVSFGFSYDNQPQIRNHPQKMI